MRDLFEVCVVNGLGVTEQPDDVRASQEHDALALFLECFRVLGQGGDVDGWVVLVGFDEVDLLLGVFKQRSHLKVQNLLVLLLGLGGQALVLVEEARRGRLNLALVDSPGLRQLMQDAKLSVHDLDRTLLSDVIQTHNTVRNALRLEDANPADFGGVVGVCAAASLRVHAADVYYTQRVTRNNTTLVERETVLLLGLRLVHETLRDRMASVDQSVCVIFNRVLFLLGETLVVRDVQVSLIGRLFCTCLPDMWAKDVPACCKHQMSASVVGLELCSSGLVDQA